MNTGGAWGVVGSGQSESGRRGLDGMPTALRPHSAHIQTTRGTDIQTFVQTPLRRHSAHIPTFCLDIQTGIPTGIPADIPTCTPPTPRIQTGIPTGIQTDIPTGIPTCTPPRAPPPRPRPRAPPQGRRSHLALWRRAAEAKLQTLAALEAEEAGEGAEDEFAWRSNEERLAEGAARPSLIDDPSLEEGTEPEEEDSVPAEPPPPEALGELPPPPEEAQEPRDPFPQTGCAGQVLSW